MKSILSSVIPPFSAESAKHVCIISPQAYQIFCPDNVYEKPFGGAEMQLSFLAREFIKLGVEVHILVEDYNQPDHEVIQDIHFWNALPRHKSIFNQITQFFRKFRQTPSTIYIQRSATPVNGILSVFCKLTNQTFIYMVAHDKEADGSDEQTTSQLTRFLKRLTFQHSAHVIVQNAYQQEGLANQGISSTLIPSLMDLSDAHLTHTQKSYILWVGRSETWKNPHHFLDIAEHLSQYQFIMICPPSKTSPHLRDEVQTRANDLPNVTFYSFVSPQNIEEFYKNASMFINTSDQEGFPNTFLQAMKYGTPLVSLSINPSNIISKYDLGFVGDGTIHETINHITTLKQNSSLYKQKAKACSSYIHQFHDSPTNAQRIKKLIFSE